MSSPRRSVSREHSSRPRASAPRSTSRSRSRSRSQDDDKMNGSRNRSATRSRSLSRGRSERDRTHTRSPSRSRSANIPRSAKIVIEKLTKNVHVGHLREIFGTYGEIQELEMPMNKQFMTNRGIAYILYSQPSYAELAISSMHEAQLDGALISVSIVLPRRRFSRSPAPMRPPPNRFGEPHRHRDPPGRPSRSDRPFDRGPPPRASPSYGGPSRRFSPGARYGRGGGGGYRDRYDDRNAYQSRGYSPSPPPAAARKRSPRYPSRSRSPSRTPPRRRGDRSPPYAGGGGGGGGRRGSHSYSNYSSRSGSRSRERGRGRR